MKKPSNPKKKPKKPTTFKAVTPIHNTVTSQHIYDIINNQNSFNTLAEKVPTLIMLLPAEIRQEMKAEYMAAVGKLFLKIIDRLSKDGFIVKR